MTVLRTGPPPLVRRSLAELARAKRALAVLSRCTGDLHVAVREEELFATVCHAIVELGGYPLAWVGLPEEDETRPIRRVAQTGTAVAFLAGMELGWGKGATGQNPAGAAIRTAEPAIVRHVLTHREVHAWRKASLKEGLFAWAALPLTTREGVVGALNVHSADPDAFDVEEMRLVATLAAELSLAVGAFRQRAREARLEQTAAQLGAAMDRASEAIVVTGLDGNVLHVNAAFELLSGYRRADIVGHPAAQLAASHLPEELMTALTRAAATGQAWSGEVVGQRKDGTLRAVEVNLSPIRGARGRPIGMVAAARIPGSEHTLEEMLERQRAAHEELARDLATLRSDADPHEIAQEICAQVGRATGCDLVSVFAFSHADRAVPLALVVPPGAPLLVDRPLPARRSRELRARSEVGPWIEEWLDRDPHDSFLQRLRQLGVQFSAYAPLRHNGKLVGLLVAGATGPDGASRLRAELAVVLEYGAIAGILLGAPLTARRAQAGLRESIRDCIAAGAFHPVFQPIVRLRSAQIVGFEALTRFADRTSPAQRFAEAWEAGLGMELEIACVARAMEAARDLPPSEWLSLNVSPVVALERDRLARVLKGADSPIVVEITETSTVPDYRALREAVWSLGSTVHLAVDDAGAGVAGLRHIVELRPHYLKLDCTLVHRLDGDPVRQALVAGMQYYAIRTGCELIAEGVETRAEAACLADLGVPLVQGHLFGRPRPVTGYHKGKARSDSMPLARAVAGATR